MATNERTPRQYVMLAVLVLLTIVAAGWLYLHFRAPPQLGADDEVFTTVDALFTALTARDEKLLTQCEERLRSYRESGKLPAGAATHLDGVIQTARQGRWRPAAESLYDFMKGQRREGHEHAEIGRAHV